MFTALSTYLKERTYLTPQELGLIEQYYTSRYLKKKEHLLQEGEICRHSGFVVKGCLRTYRVDEEGKEHTLKFVIENWWAYEPESYSNGTPSAFNIQALEDTELILCLKDDFQYLLERIPNLRVLTEKLQSNSFNASQQRIYHQIGHSPEERYKSFIAEYPDIFNRVPLHMLASYLGMSRETITRIRAHYAKK
ncbi:putative transcriptional regulator, Crp/Fnr family [Chitinophaga pinensis DSM 2588]|uniref:Transcriptional regulator, Crp/Fnr family n=2 Tax=Chitinophaga pinensis TaxID=79329 RepID=A0A979GYX8_CHIPD|nr:putative transcriptional regulator, Crp/Fnr family [Chitinophaga pinensis DSM 2588]